MDKTINEIDFYEQKLKEAKSKLYQTNSDAENKETKILDQCVTDKFAAYQGDCIEVLKGIPSNSIHYSVYSPPFSSLFTYSNSLSDMGNGTDAEFNNHFRYLVPELYRVMMPGRVMSIHCSDIPSMLERDGVQGLKDFPGDIIRMFQEVGFIYHSRVLITKNPLLEAVRTKSHGLMHKQLIKDSSKCRMGLPDYVVSIRKPGDNPEPIAHPNGFESYIGDREEPKFAKNEDQGVNKYSHHVWQRYAANVWDDVNQSNTLNAKLARESGDERHMCPLQIDVINRCIELWSNPGDTVLSPFGGIGSEGFCALKMGRKPILIELKKSYYDVLVRNLKSVSVTRARKLI